MTDPQLNSDEEATGVGSSMTDEQGYVEYDSNNSGGDWWLTDGDWLALELAGWEVDWFAKRADHEHKWMRPEGDGRWLGALAAGARRYGVNLEEAIREWEGVTEQQASALGCSCCGVPHAFSQHTADGTCIDSYSPDFPMYGDEY